MLISMSWNVRAICKRYRMNRESISCRTVLVLERRHQKWIPTTMRKELMSSRALCSAILWPQVYLPFKEFSSPTTAFNFHLELQCKPFEALLSFLSSHSHSNTFFPSSHLFVSARVERNTHSQASYQPTTDTTSVPRRNEQIRKQILFLFQYHLLPMHKLREEITFSHFSGSVWWRRTEQIIKEWTIRIYLIFS